MRLASVRDLKAELLHEMQEPFLFKIARRHLVEISGEPAAKSALPRPSLALGVSAAEKSYLLAIRMFDRRPETQLMARRAFALAKGEATVFYVGRLRAPRTAPTHAPYRGRARPLVPGFSVAHWRSTAGTLGAFVTTRSDSYRYVYMLSNNHVLADTNRGRLKDPVLQPGPSDGGRRTDTVGWLTRARKIITSGNEVDAAIAAVSSERDYDAVYDGRRLRGIRPDVDIGDLVWKVGRTTGHTVGRITAFGLDNVEVDYSDAGDGSFVCSFDDQIEIRAPRGRFSEGGDSGSLVIGDDLRAVGLLFAGSQTGVTVANPIQKVLQAFGARLEA